MTEMIWVEEEEFTGWCTAGTVGAQVTCTASIPKPDCEYIEVVAAAQLLTEIPVRVVSAADFEIAKDHLIEKSTMPVAPA